jgi:hypothetical protein
MPRSLKTDAVSWDTWCILKEYQQCSRVVQKEQCHCPLPRQRHMQVLHVFKTCSILLDRIGQVDYLEYL